MIIVYLLAFVLLLVPAGSVWAEAKNEIKYTYYPVQLTTEDTAQQVLRAMIKAMPSNVGDTRRLASARPTFNVEYRVKRKFQKCKIIDAQVKSSCTILLPSFQGGGADLEYRLEPIFKYVEEHELTHCSINTKYANMLEQKLLKLGQVECVEIEGVAKAELKRVWDEGWRAQDAFDAHEQERGVGGIEWVHFNHTSASRAAPPRISVNGVSNLNDNMESSGIYQKKDGTWSNW